jgi:methyltransferase (TIGR00027 family)
MLLLLCCYAQRTEQPWVPPHVRLVPTDFDREDLGKVLTSQKYAVEDRTFFIMEGVTEYLTETGLKKTFDFLAGAAPGSRLACTFLQQDFIDGKKTYGAEKAYDKYVVKDKTWLFGLDPKAWPAFFKEYGWRVIKDIGHNELAEQYVKPTGRKLATTQIERMACAEKLEL